MLHVMMEFFALIMINVMNKLVKKVVASPNPQDMDTGKLYEVFSNEVAKRLANVLKQSGKIVEEDIKWHFDEVYKDIETYQVKGVKVHAAIAPKGQGWGKSPRNR